MTTLSLVGVSARAAPGPASTSASASRVTSTATAGATFCAWVRRSVVACRVMGTSFGIRSNAVDPDDTPDAFPGRSLARRLHRGRHTAGESERTLAQPSFPTERPGLQAGA